jgi:hypothetical protein
MYVKSRIYFFLPIVSNYCLRFVYKCLTQVKIFHNMSVVFKQLQFIDQEVWINRPTNVKNVKLHNVKTN